MHYYVNENLSDCEPVLRLATFKMHRALVGLRTSNGKYKVPKFSECLLECFGKGVNSVQVNFSLENGTLILTECEQGSELRHSPECPVKILASLSEPEENPSNNNGFPMQQIGIATSVVIESSDCHVLLTRRSAQLRSSPKVWVFPGGHIEQGETVLEAGVREVKEETGLDIMQEKASVLGLWENVYPLLLGVGIPISHILTVYLHTQMNETFEELTQKIIPNPDEVESYCWLSSSTLSKLFTCGDSAKIEGKQYIYENGKINEKHLDYTSLFNRWLWQQQDPYSGVNYALRKWRHKLNSESTQCKL